jgi:hypothetical protein
MIDSVRNTVLSILNKNNFGYLSPADFNLYAKQAQLEIFDQYFYDYNYQINKENIRQSGTGYADIARSLEEVIDTFSTVANFTTNTFALPADYFLLNKLLPTGSNYEMEQVSNSKINLLLSSYLTAPSLSFPAYVQNGNNATAYPDTITSGTIQYIRYPLEPNWTYSTLTAGEPVFDQGQADYQDFELPADDEPRLVNKILQYSGVSIREMDVVNYSLGQEQLDDQASK